MDQPEPAIMLYPCLGGCNESKQDGDFPRTDAGNRSSICFACRKRQDQEASSRKKQQRVEAKIREFGATLRGTNIQLEHLCEFAAAASRYYGGAEGFMRTWIHQIEAADPGSARRLASMRDLMQLFKHATEMRETAPDLAGMTDAELDEILRLKILAATGGSQEDGDGDPGPTDCGAGAAESPDA